MQLPFGAIDGNVLEVNFSTADYSIPAVLSAVREHLDRLEEMNVIFLGAQTVVPSGPTPVFKPVSIAAIFEYIGKGDARPVLERAYTVIWHGIVTVFPNETDWSKAKECFGSFIVSQADLIRARTEAAAEE